MKNKLNLLPINIQLFAEDPTQEELDQLAKDLIGTDEDPTGDDGQTPEQLAEEQKLLDEQKVLEEETKALETEAQEKGITLEELKEQKKLEQDDPEDEEIKKTKGGIKALREKQKADAKRAKELEEEQIKLRKDREEISTKLIRAIKLGIKGDTEEEILLNLENHDIKETAEKGGLTEDQVRKEKELEDKLNKLNERESEFMFNQRAFALQREKNLDEKQLTEFISKAASIGINLFSNPKKFTEIYDQIMLTPDSGDSKFKQLEEDLKKAREEIEQLRSGNGVPGKGVPGNTDTKFTGDFLADLRNMKGKNEK